MRPSRWALAGALGAAVVLLALAIPASGMLAHGSPAPTAHATTPPNPVPSGPGWHSSGPGPYTVSFQEAGLPSGTNWSVTLFGLPGSHAPGGWLPAVAAPAAFHRGATNRSNGTMVDFSVGNGTYRYLVHDAWGNGLYVPSPEFGNVTVNGSGATVDVAFAPLVFYHLSFVEAGLPAGTFWSVHLGTAGAPCFGYAARSVPDWGFGSWNGSTDTAVNFTLPDGAYGFAIGNVTSGSSLYTPDPAFGPVTIDGANVTIDVSFTAVALYAVSFAETGLPAGTLWHVVLSNATMGEFGNFSFGATVNVTVPDGVYNFSIENVSNGTAWFAPSPAYGTVTVDGAGVSVTVAFAPMPLYAVTFTESGLPNGTWWFVALVGPACAGGLQGANGTNVTFLVPNGTYGFGVGGAWNATGTFVPAPAFGAFTVDGANVSVDVSFTFEGRGGCGQAPSPAAARPVGARTAA